MRKIVWTVVAAAAVAVAVAGCGAGAAGSPASAPAGSARAATAGYNIEFVNPLPSFPVWKLAGQCMAKEAKKLGVGFTQAGPTGEALDPTTMVTEIQQAIADKENAIITFPASAGFSPVLTRAQSAGIVTATIAGPGVKGSGADINNGYDWAQLGQLYVSTIAKRAGMQYVGLMTQNDTGTGGQWMSGVRAAAAKTKNVKIVGAVYTNDDATKALPETVALLTANPNINVIASNMGTATQGAVAAIKSKGLAGKIAYVGNGLPAGGSQGLANGTVYQVLVQNVCLGAENTVKATVAGLKNKNELPTIGAAPELVRIPTAMADKSNWTAFEKQGWE